MVKNLSVKLNGGLIPKEKSCFQEKKRHMGKKKKQIYIFHNTHY